MVELRRIRRIFEAALDLPTTARETFVREQCGEDEALFLAVCELLTVPHEELRYLDPPDTNALQAALVRQVALPELEGTRIGKFRLGRVLASGGMGVVFEAEQDDPKRRVAIKILRSGLRDPDRVRRFRYESEMLARLTHAAIAKVFEAGVHELHVADAKTHALPWFAMELIEDAHTILQYARDAGLTLKSKLELAITLCEAIHHAHQRGIIHRDLKPDNILIDAQGQPKIIDFGVARDTGDDASLLTRTGQIIGTLRYMSPEQLAGKRETMDARTDVYALGIVIFELTAGDLPYRTDELAPHELARHILEQPFRRLRQVDPRLPYDLEVIVAKAMEKEPSRRYASAAALGADLQRMLRGETILARPASWSYQARSFARRHIILVVSAISLLVILSGATIFSVFAARDARRSEAIAIAARDRATRLVERQFAASSRAITEFLKRLQALSGATELRRDMTRAALNDLEALVAESSDEPRIKAALALAFVELGDAQGGQLGSNLGAIDDAERCYREASQLANELLKLDPQNLSAKLYQARACAGFGGIASARGESERCVEHFVRAIALYDEVAAGDPLLHDLAITAVQGALSSALFLSAQGERAAVVIRDRATRTEAALRAAPNDLQRLGNHGISIAQRGASAMQGGALEEAEALLREAKQIGAQLHALEPANSQHARALARHMSLLADLLLKARRFEEAEAEMTQSLELLTRLQEADPASASEARVLALGYGMRGQIAFESARRSALDAPTMRAAFARAAEDLTRGIQSLEALAATSKIERGEFAPLLERWNNQLQQCQSVLSQ